MEGEKMKMDKKNIIIAELLEKKGRLHDDEGRELGY